MLYFRPGILLLLVTLLGSCRSPLYDPLDATVPTVNRKGELNLEATLHLTESALVVFNDAGTQAQLSTSYSPIERLGMHAKYTRSTGRAFYTLGLGYYERFSEDVDFQLYLMRQWGNLDFKSSGLLIGSNYDLISRQNSYIVSPTVTLRQTLGHVHFDVLLHMPIRFMEFRDVQLSGTPSADTERILAVSHRMLEPAVGLRVHFDSDVSLLFRFQRTFDLYDTNILLAKYNIAGGANFTF